MANGITASPASVVVTEFNPSGGGGVQVSVHATRLDMILAALTELAIGHEKYPGWGSDDHLSTLHEIHTALEATIEDVRGQREEERNMEHVGRIWDSPLDCSKCEHFHEYTPEHDSGEGEETECGVLAAGLGSGDCPILTAAHTFPGAKNRN